MGIVIGINASRSRSGGAIAHLCGILNECNPELNGIEKIHIWSYNSMNDVLPDCPWLIKHTPPELAKSLIKQIFWEKWQLPNEIIKNKCDILLNTDAGTVCRYSPSIVISQDMLSYEKGEMSRFGFTLARFRLIALKYIQAFSMKHANGVIFLTNYASKTIQHNIGRIDQFRIIPHGVDEIFKQKYVGRYFDLNSSEEIQCIYVSNAAMYKHQWHLVNAISKLREKGYRIKILLVGGGKGPAQKLLERTISELDPQRNFVEQTPFMKHDALPKILSTADIFVFASSCENMPVTLIEAMAGGIPIACSNRGPMPEVLNDGGVYFDPENPSEIAEAIQSIISDSQLRISISIKAKNLSEQYSWRRCSRETFDYITEIANLFNSKNKK
jgi:glycosyltransferase involved in cell wall biosynthesis